MRKPLRLFPAFLALVAIGIACDPYAKPPTIVPIHPESGSTVQAGPVEIDVVITDDNGVKSVLFQLPGAMPVHPSCCPPDTYWLVWDASTVPQNQWDTIRVTATDNSNNESSKEMHYFVVAK